MEKREYCKSVLGEMVRQMKDWAWQHELSSIHLFPVQRENENPFHSAILNRLKCESAISVPTRRKIKKNKVWDTVWDIQ